MNPAELIRQFTRDGAGLTIFTPAPQPMVISAEIGLKPRALIYHIAGSDYTGGVHHLDFDEAHAPHALGVEFVRDARPVAYLCPVGEDSKESADAWREWQQWLNDPGNRSHHEESIAAEIAAFEAD